MEKSEEMDERNILDIRTKSSNPKIEARIRRPVPGNMRLLQRPKFGHRHAAKFAIPIRHHTRRNIGRNEAAGIRGMHRSAAVNQHPDVNANNNSNTSDVQIHEENTLRKKNQLYHSITK